MAGFPGMEYTVKDAWSCRVPGTWNRELIETLKFTVWTAPTEEQLRPLLDWECAYLPAAMPDLLAPDLLANRVECSGECKKMRVRLEDTPPPTKQPTIELADSQRERTQRTKKPTGPSRQLISGGRYVPSDKSLRIPRRTR